MKKVKLQECNLNLENPYAGIIRIRFGANYLGASPGGNFGKHILIRDKTP
jgi:hypothetical protein